MPFGFFTTYDCCQYNENILPAGLQLLLVSLLEVETTPVCFHQLKGTQPNFLEF